MKNLFLLVIFLVFYNKAYCDNLNDNFLIASPQMLDSRFKESIVLLFNHNTFGASGLVINKEQEKISTKELFNSTNILLPEGFVNKQLTIFWGGPINTHHLFFIHSPEYKNDNSIISNESFIVSRSSDILYDIAKNKGPKNFIIIRGISVWSPNQLDEELIRGSWDKKVNYYLSIFDNDKNMWQILVNSQGA